MFIILVEKTNVKLRFGEVSSIIDNYMPCLQMKVRVGIVISMDLRMLLNQKSAFALVCGCFFW